MADPTDQDKASKEPNLELPSLSLRRKKKDKPPKREATQPPEPTEAADTAEAPAPPPAPATEKAPEEPAPEPSASTMPLPQPKPAAAPKPAPAGPPSGPRPAPPAPPKPPPAAPSPAPQQAQQETTTPVPTPPAPAVPEADTDPHPSVGDAAPEAARERRPSRVRAGWAATQASLERLDDRIDALAFKKVPGHLAAIITGIVCGIVSVLLSWLAASGCDAVRGVGTCGSFGMVALVAIIAIDVLVGGILLRAWGVNDPVSTALLGVGLVAVFVMLFLLSSVGSIWMVLVIPVLTALMFLLSWWVTAKIVETDD